MKKIISFIIVLTLGFSFANGETLSLYSYLQQLIENDSEYKNIFSDSKSILGQNMSIKGVYDWKLNSQVSKGFFKTMASGSAYINDMNTIAADVHVSKLLRESGTALSVGYAYEQSEMTIVGYGASKSYKPYLYIAANQPLVQNFMGNMVQYPVRKTEIAEKLSKIQDEAKAEKYFETQLLLYYDWVLVYLSLKTTNEHYLNLVKLHSQVEKQYANDFISITDLLRSKEGLRKTEDMMAAQLNQLNIIVETISNKIGRKAIKSNSWSEIALVPAEYVIKNITGDRKRNRIEEIYKLRFFSLKLDIENIIENKKLKLNMFANVKQYDLSNSPTGIFGDFGKTDYTIGFQMDVDLEGHDINGKLIETEEKTKQLENEWILTQKNLEVINHKLESTLVENKNSIKRYQEIVEWSNQRFQQELKRYESGKVFLKTVVDTQSELLSNRNTLLQSEIAGYKLMVQRMSFDDQLFDYVKNIVPDLNK